MANGRLDGSGWWAWLSPGVGAGAVGVAGGAMDLGATRQPGIPPVSPSMTAAWPRAPLLLPQPAAELCGNRGRLLGGLFDLGELVIDLAQLRRETMQPDQKLL